MPYLSNKIPLLALAVAGLGLSTLVSVSTHRISLEALPPTAAGAPWPPAGTGSPAPGLVPAPAPGPDAAKPSLAGLEAQGRVKAFYVRVENNVMLALERTPQHLRKPENLYVDIEFPDLLRNGAGSATGLLGEAYEGAQVGDIVALRFAHRHDPKFFPVRETTKVTQLVARKDTELARDFERRILARNGQGLGSAVARQSGGPNTLQGQLGTR